MSDSPPPCLDTSEALLVDGANGVCPGVELVPGQPSLAGFAVLTTVVAVAGLVRWKGIAPRVLVALLAAVASVAALPGWAAMLATRADAPAAAGESAADVARLHDTIRGFALRHGCARVTVGHCVACEPIARLALAGLACELPARIELHEDAWSAACVEHGEVLSCGSPPR